MTLKLMKPVDEVKHVFLRSQDMTELDNTVKNYLNAGWSILEVKLIHFDFVNGQGTVLYIFARFANE